MRVLALSSSRVGNGGYLAAAAPVIQNFLGKTALQIAFVPFAAVDGDDEAYVEKVRVGLAALPHSIHVVSAAKGKALVNQCDVVMVGGGNTFKLLHDLYQHDLFELIQQRVKSGAPYIGWSAGANLTGKTICTTNDMPIIQPRSFAALHFLPFQINPHYYNVVIEGFHGETRDQRLAEFCQLHPTVPVVGLPEGTALRREGDSLHFVGEKAAVLFQRQEQEAALQKSELAPGADISFLLKT